MNKYAIALVATLALPGAAFAQSSTTTSNVGPKAEDWELTLSGNGSSDNDFDNHNFGASASVGKYISPNFLIGVRQSLNFNDVPGGNDVVNGATRGFGDYVFDLGRFRPYIGVSIGGIYGEGINDTLAAGPEIGLKYYADSRTFLFLQTEYQFAFDDVGDATDAADDGQFFHSLGIGFNF